MREVVGTEYTAVVEVGLVGGGTSRRPLSYS